ncbi:hypothetical protein BMS3Abin14_00680 [bacterium BMS3Abin14]|nr:hypothetical protein BMS3Abin14_00680 [bacterium BMS3Abin14]
MKRIGMIGLVFVGFVAGILLVNTYSGRISIAKAENVANTSEQDAYKLANMTRPYPFRYPPTGSEERII